MNKPTTIKYKMRAECQPDFGRFLKLVSIESVKAQHVYVKGTKLPDMIIEFTSTLTLEQIRDIISGIVDGHVMLETVQLAALYTGERA